MNERIKELCKQAADQTSAAFGSSNFRQTEWESLFRETFADLIIRDCVDICRQEWYLENNKFTCGLPSRDIAIHLGEKFGIERCTDMIITKMLES